MLQSVFGQKRVGIVAQHKYLRADFTVNTYIVIVFVVQFA